ncbi:MAG TPA: glycosyltransferase [Candidatus Limnocylindria bacterium]|nr:glycosyltransferase [Candidatus Limnocylindria bacterium]
MKRLRDVHVVYIITKLELGGAQKVCLSLFKGFANNTITTTLISGNDGILSDSVRTLPHTILLDTLTREVTGNHIIKEIRCFITLVQELKKLRQQHPKLIVHTHSTKAGILGRWAAWCAGITTRIHTVHGFAFHEYQPRLKWLIIYIAELLTNCITTHFVCVSSADVKTGIRLLPGFSHKHSIIRAAVDSRHFFKPATPLGHPESSPQPFIFGTIACFKPQKNLFDLMRAFNSVYQKNPHVRLEVVGDGQLRPALEQWIEKHHLTDVITLHGWQHDVAPFMQRWHAFTLSSLWEGLPCAVIEARFLQLPVICYNTGGIHDVIIDGVNGRLVPKGQWQQLAHALLEISKNTTLYNGLRSHVDTLADFDDQEMIRQHVQLYKDYF